MYRALVILLNFTCVALLYAFNSIELVQNLTLYNFKNCCLSILKVQQLHGDLHATGYQIIH